ncbi:MAG: acetyl-CoA carboxylase biotin carboxyl carrier protein subunit [Actinobacteria bacterium]|nr:acetyl-CoA carboxylase biotin carboxyl carrier protein subunit [Actinomycetota bacterium]
MTEPNSTPPGGEQEFVRTVWEEARDLVKRLEGSTVQRFSVEAAGTKIEIERVAGTVVPPAAGTAGAAAAPDADEGAELDGRHPVVSPLVGTFYRAAQPGAKAFVEEGDVVDEGQTVGIVEAMKLMNHVKADQAGRVAQILCTDGDWVEFEQPLMLLEPVE